jgi:hypothetical protein
MDGCFLNRLLLKESLEIRSTQEFLHNTRKYVTLSLLPFFKWQEVISYEFIYHIPSSSKYNLLCSQEVIMIWKMMKEGTFLVYRCKKFIQQKY